MSKAWSIRARLTRGVLGMVVLAWLATIALALVFLDYETNEMLDEELQALAETVVLSLDSSPGSIIPRTMSSPPTPPAPSSPASASSSARTWKHARTAARASRRSRPRRAPRSTICLKRTSRLTRWRR